MFLTTGIFGNFEGWRGNSSLSKREFPVALREMSSTGLLRRRCCALRPCNAVLGLSVNAAARTAVSSVDAWRRRGADPQQPFHCQAHRVRHRSTAGCEPAICVCHCRLRRHLSSWQSGRVAAALWRAGRAARDSCELATYRTNVIIADDFMLSVWLNYTRFTRHVAGRHYRPTNDLHCWPARHNLRSVACCLPVPVHPVR